MCHRHDLAEIFAASAVLAALAGRQEAETAGIARELRNAGSTEGFSFVRLAADMAGAAFAEKLTKEPMSLAQFAAGFHLSDYFPEECTNLREGMPQGLFHKDYGTVWDRPFLAERERIRRSILAMPFYRLTEYSPSDGSRRAPLSGSLCHPWRSGQ